MAQLFNIEEDKVVINKLQLKYLEGTILHAGQLEIAGGVHIQHNLRVVGTITADTFNVKNLVTENGSLDSVGQWIYNTEAELNGKGFSWEWGNGNAQLQYRTGQRIWSTANIDLSSELSYQIDNTPVLSLNKLGDTVVDSNLRSVGTLSDLNVSGNTSIGQFVFFDSGFNRLGIGTEEPNSSISIFDNNVEITIGSPANDVANIGTWSCSDLALVTDNLTRVTIKNNGEVHVASESNPNGVFRVHGTIYADRIVSDFSIPQIDVRADKVAINKLVLRYLEGSIIHAGSLDVLGATSVQSDLSVTGNISANTITADTITVKNLVTESGASAAVAFDHLSEQDTTVVCSADFDLTPEKSYKINGQVVLNSTELGDQITASKLTSLGILNTLVVAGGALFKDTIEAGNIVLNANTINSKNLLVLGSGGFTGITITSNNAITLGATNNPADVVINGSLTVDRIITDTRIEKTSSVEFKGDSENTIYGKGLVWNDGTTIAQFMLVSGPDRIWSSNSLDLKEGHGYYANGQLVLDDQQLGSAVTKSNLTTLGTLDNLTVSGLTSVTTLNASNINVGNTTVTDSGIANNGAVVTVDTDYITLGSHDNTRNIKVAGKLSVGINNPDPAFGLQVLGDVSLGGKKFTNGATAPTAGSNQIGDICWNNAPYAGSYIGWVCITAGSPGQWLGFGLIANQ
jgi:hypothetical protein